MESQNIEFRAVIKFLTKEGARPGGCKAKEIHRCMADMYGDSSPKYSTVAKWSAEFKYGMTQGQVALLMSSARRRWTVLRDLC